MSTDINRYLKLQKSLINEKAKLEARLAEISQVLGQGAVATKAPAAKPGGRRQFSEATKAKMRAAQRARWAKLKGKAVPAPAAKKSGRKLSEETKAKMRAAHQARWAKKKAGKAK